MKFYTELTVLVALSVQYTSAFKCYSCASRHPACAQDAFNPNDPEVRVIECDSICQKTSIITDGQPSEFYRFCANEGGNVLGLGTFQLDDIPGRKYKISRCDTDFCNGEPTPVELGPLTCYSCANDESCKTAPTNAPVNKCPIGRPCLTIRQEKPDADGTLVSVVRRCSNEPYTPTDGCDYRILQNGDFESSCYCSTDKCNVRAERAKGPLLNCHKCGTDSNADLCEKHPFIESGVTEQCGQNKPCLTIRKEMSNGTVISVERRCATETTTPIDKCVYGGHVNGETESHCYCKSDKCNKDTTSAIAALNCYDCSMAQDSTNSECMKSLFDTTTARTEKCGPRSPCTVTRVEKPDGTVRSVQRGCGYRSYPSDQPCEYTTLSDGDLESTCYCNSDKCNFFQTSAAKPPINCYTCGAGNGEENCKKHPFPNDASDVGPKTCESREHCVTVRNETSEGALLSVERRCVPEPDFYRDRCSYAVLWEGTRPIRQSTCYCSTTECNHETTLATDPDRSTDAPTTPRTASAASLKPHLYSMLTFVLYPFLYIFY